MPQLNRLTVILVILLELVNIQAERTDIKPIDFNTVWRAIKQIESGNTHYDKNGGVHISRRGAIGIAQIKGCTVEFFNLHNGTDYKIADAFDRYVNERIGCWYFNWLWNRYDEKACAIMAYNVGHNSHLRPRKYLRKVLEALDESQESRSENY